MDMYRSHVLVCAGAGCISSGCKPVRDALQENIEKFGLGKEVKVVETGCMGPCDLGPVIMVFPDGVFYCKLKPGDADEIVRQHLLKGKVVTRLLHRPAGSAELVASFDRLDFFKRQTRIALRNIGLINPESVEEYIARDGYRALGKVLSEMTPQQVVDAIKESGLRGRGGAGFPTGLKWGLAARAAGYPKYVVCNADEGNPGTFMDRSILGGDPHSVLEAMAICGYAIGSPKGYIYVRVEYPLAVEKLEIAINKAREYGLLGKNIFGTGFSFDIEIRVGAGAFVCGEETALLASIQGRRGEPRPRPPFPTQEGLWGKPTVINNVETWACIPPIILNGPRWFAGIGTEKSKGTKVFSLAGKINNTGLVEVPMGTTLREIIFDIGGGVPAGKRFKAVQTGGPSGGCVPQEYLDTPVDYESLTSLGAIMGSGGMIIVDEDTCMVDLAKFFLQFIQEESCGQCSPCRIGTRRMLEIMERITSGGGREGDIELLEELGWGIKSSALCGLGQAAPNPVISTLRYFRREYEDHIRHGRCRASVCAALFDSPCQNTCPAGVDVPLFIDHIRNGRFAEAYLEVRRDNPFPSVCGRVCNHPCESKCRRGQMDEPLAIRALKRFASDWMLDRSGGLPDEAPSPSTGKRVAVVGAGPAGLTAAYYLARLGHRVVVFEALPVAGGMMAVGIPEYRLPEKILQSEIRAIEKLGVTIKTKTRFGKDVTLEDLKNQGFDAVFIALGAHEDQKLGIPGEELEGVVPGIEFLRSVKLGGAPELKDKTVLVVGGGNAAVYSARTALRLGAGEVQIVYRRRKEDMPAFKDEILEAEKEGVRFNFLAAPVRVLGVNGRLTGVECRRMTLGEFDAGGRRKPVPLEDSEFVLHADVVISAIGRAVQADGVGGAGLKPERGLAAVDPATMDTGIPWLFAGGDCVTGPDTVIGAIAQGKMAAAAIDRYLGGTGAVVPPRVVERKISGLLIEEKRPREVVSHLPVEDRKGFKEVELSFTESQAAIEAMRCLRCDVRE
ncbi:MAG: NADH-quinone oxidoreductase subunit NuoF [Bacillota bacterium]